MVKGTLRLGSSPLGNFAAPHSSPAKLPWRFKSQNGSEYVKVILDVVMYRTGTMKFIGQDQRMCTVCVRCSLMSSSFTKSICCPSLD